MQLEEIKYSTDSKEEKYSDGFLEVSLSSVKKFAKFAIDNFDNKPAYVFRGQENSDEWTLQTTLSRLTNKGTFSYEILTNHLEKFKLATRGRRGPNPKELSENELWALGQHYGLATPLLDWTYSYWVALFFAFNKPNNNICRRAVYAVNKRLIEKISHSKESKIEWIDPYVHDNPRITSQSGLLLKMLFMVNLETWIQDNFKNTNEVVLLKVSIPNEDYDYCLRDLNRMNINHLSLFPDLIGAAEYANLILRLGSNINGL